MLRSLYIVASRALRNSVCVCVCVCAHACVRVSLVLQQAICPPLRPKERTPRSSKSNASATRRRRLRESTTWPSPSPTPWPGLGATFSLSLSLVLQCGGRARAADPRSTVAKRIRAAAWALATTRQTSPSGSLRFGPMLAGRVRAAAAWLLSHPFARTLDESESSSRMASLTRLRARTRRLRAAKSPGLSPMGESEQQSLASSVARTHQTSPSSSLAAAASSQKPAASSQQPAASSQQQQQQQQQQQPDHRTPDESEQSGPGEKRCRRSPDESPRAAAWPLTRVCARAQTSSRAAA